MFSRILVPLDGSALAEQALGPALAIASQPGGEITLLRAPVIPYVLDQGIEGVDPYIEAWAEQQYKNARQTAAEYLQTFKQLHQREGVALYTQVGEGEPAMAILDYAAHHDLVVMSTHGYSGLTQWVLGSVTEKVLAAATCPVLIVRSTQPIRRILVALDGSALAEAALAPVLELAARLDSEVTLFRAVEEVTPFERAQLNVGGTDLADRLQWGLVKEATRYLESLTPFYSHPGLSLQRVVEIGWAAHHILDYAQHQAIDVIAMVTHGRTGLAKWVYGSVAEKVLRGTQCSMLIVRPAGKRAT